MFKISRDSRFVKINNQIHFMKKLVVLFLLFIGLYGAAQETGNYYVAGSALNLRSQPNATCDVVFKLKQYDNLLVKEFNGDWAAVQYDDKTGYVHKSYIKKGKAETYTHSYRTGAICNDGTRSNATGRGACSHHGGVNYWLTNDRVEVSIIQ